MPSDSISYQLDTTVGEEHLYIIAFVRQDVVLKQHYDTLQQAINTGQTALAQRLQRQLLQVLQNHQQRVFQHQKSEAFSHV